MRCLSTGRSPGAAMPAAGKAAASEESGAAETSRGAFSVLSRQEYPLKRRLSDAMLAAQPPDPNKCAVHVLSSRGSVSCSVYTAVSPVHVVPCCAVYLAPLTNGFGAAPR